MPAYTGHLPPAVPWRLQPGELGAGTDAGSVFSRFQSGRDPRETGRAAQLLSAPAAEDTFLRSPAEIAALTGRFTDRLIAAKQPVSYRTGLGPTGPVGEEHWQMAGAEPDFDLGTLSGFREYSDIVVVPGPWESGLPGVRYPDIAAMRQEIQIGKATEAKVAGYVQELLAHYDAYAGSVAAAYSAAVDAATVSAGSEDFEKAAIAQVNATDLGQEYQLLEVREDQVGQVIDMLNSDLDAFNRGLGLAAEDKVAAEDAAAAQLAADAEKVRQIAALEGTGLFTGGTGGAAGADGSSTAPVFGMSAEEYAELGVQGQSLVETAYEQAAGEEKFDRKVAAMDRWAGIDAEGKRKVDPETAEPLSIRFPNHSAVDLASLPEDLLKKMWDETTAAGKVAKTRAGRLLSLRKFVGPDKLLGVEWTAEELLDLSDADRDAIIADALAAENTRAREQELGLLLEQAGVTTGAVGFGADFTRPFGGNYGGLTAEIVREMLVGHHDRQTAARTQATEQAKRERRIGAMGAYADDLPGTAAQLAGLEPATFREMLDRWEQEKLAEEVRGREGQLYGSLFGLDPALAGGMNINLALEMLKQRATEGQRGAVRPPRGMTLQPLQRVE